MLAACAIESIEKRKQLLNYLQFFFRLSIAIISLHKICN